MEKLTESYHKDVQTMASKSRFGYFNIPPSAFSGHNAFPEKKVIRDENGKVKTENRNLFSGVTATGVLQKSFFSYSPSYLPGDVYYDPGKLQSKAALAQSLRMKDKDSFKPASGSTEPPAKASYPYQAQKCLQRDPRSFRDENGRIITCNPNIKGSTARRAVQERLKYYRNAASTGHLPPAPENSLKKVTSQNKTDEAPFKLGFLCKETFSSTKQIYGAVAMPEKKVLQFNISIQEHDAKFRPSNCSLNSEFSYPEYIACPVTPKSAVPMESSKKQPFKLIKVDTKLKPTPSITKMNVLRGLR